MPNYLEYQFISIQVFQRKAPYGNNTLTHPFNGPLSGTTRVIRYNNNNNDRLTAFDPGQPG